MTLTAPPRPDQPASGSVAERAPKRPLQPERIAAILTLIALVVASVAALIDIDISLGNVSDSVDNAERFFHRVGGLKFPEAGELLSLTLLTLGLVLTGTLLAAALSVPIAYLAAENTSPGPGWRAAARFIGVLARAVPDVVLAMVFVLLFSLGSLPGILAIGLHSIGMISKMFADAIEQIDEGPRMAIRAGGGTRLQEFGSGVLPQVMPSWVATVLHRNDINLRGSVILGYVGVAGLGLEMSYAFKSLDYGLGLGIALVMFLLCVGMEIVSSTVRAAMLGTGGSGGRILGLLRRRRGTADTALPADIFATPEAALRRPWTLSRVRNVTAGWVAAILVVLAVWVSDITWSDFLTFWAKLPPVLASFWPPNFGVYGAETMFLAMWDTIVIALAATLLAIIASLIIGSLAARNVAPNRPARGGFRLLLVVIRGIPELILAIVLIVITGLGSQAGTLALAIGGVGLLGKLIADSLEEVPNGPERALAAAGAGRGQIFAGATVPQSTRALIGHSFYMLDTNIRSATMLGLVGAGGVGYYLLNAGQGSNYQLVSSIVLMILVTVLLVEGLAMWMRRVFR